MSFKKDNYTDEKQRELEIESILEETHYLADQERMAETAQKYRARPVMDEIFSNASKEPRLTNKNPFDDDTVEAEEVCTTNTIVGEKTATTMNASLVLDGNEENVQTPQEAEQELLKRKKEEQEKKEKEEQLKLALEEEKIVSLSPEYDKDTCFAKDVIDEVEQFKEDKSHIETINTIDIDLNENQDIDEHQEQPQQSDEIAQSNSTSKYEQVFGVENKPSAKKPKRVVAKVPIYKNNDDTESINIKAGRFSDVLENEYQEYIKSKNPSVIAHVIKQEPKENYDIEDEQKDTRSTREKVMSAVVGIFSKDESDDEDMPKEKAKIVDDYTGNDEEKVIMSELNQNIKKLFVRSILTGVIAVVSVILTIIVRVFPDSICAGISFAPAAYAVFNFVILGFSIFINRVAVLSGLTPLIKFKGNSDTAVSVGAVAGIIQCFVSFFCLGDATKFSINYYVVIVLLAFFVNNIGKLFMVLRVKNNFIFTSSKIPKYAAKIYNNETVASQMMSGTAVDRPIIAYQHKTKFPSNFLKISYAPDPSEDLASKVAPITTVAAIIITVLYGFAKGSFSDAINTLALITAISIPVATLLAVNLPIHTMCKKLLSFGAMLSGYPSVKQFCDSTAVMIDANELFPPSCIELDGIKTYEEYCVDESLLCGIAVLKEGQSPLAKAFDSVVAETEQHLPEVESVLYEDEMGLVGWINGERILAGSRNLMSKYNVLIPHIDYEEKYTNAGKQVTYIARAGRLIALFVTRYHIDQELKVELQRAEANGISFLIRTTDYNITNDLVSSMYNVFYRSVKVLPTGLGNVLKETQTTVEETSRSYLITCGKVSSLSRAVSACVKIKHNISLAILIQLIAIVLGILISATLSLYAGVGVMGSLEVLIYSLFWTVAAVFAPSIQKP